MLTPSVDQMTEVAIKYLFPKKKVSDSFRNDLHKFIKRYYESNGCVALWIAKDVNLTKDFRNFMAKYPELSCEKRQIIIYQNGSMSFREDYHKDKRITVLSA